MARPREVLDKRDGIEVVTVLVARYPNLRHYMATAFLCAMLPAKALVVVRAAVQTLTDMEVVAVVTACFQGKVVAHHAPRM